MRPARRLTLLLFSQAVLFFSFGHAQTDNPPPHISSTIAFEHLAYKVAPPYPTAGLDKRIQNNEFLRIVIDEEGKVAEAKVQIGHPAFATVSLDAVKEWKYKPFLANGTPTRVMTDVLIAFRLQGAEEEAPGPDNGMPISVTVTARSPVKSSLPGEHAEVSIPAAELESRLINKVEPKYPEMARIARIEGRCVLHVVVSKNGNVASLQAISGHPILLQAALDAVRNWRYKPYEVDGKPVTVESTVAVVFQKSDSPAKPQ